MSGRLCDGCSQSFGPDGFSGKQWKGKGGMRKCKVCLGGEPLVAAARADIEAPVSPESCVKMTRTVGDDASVIKCAEPPNGITGSSELPSLCTAVRPVVGGSVTPFIADVLLSCAACGQLPTSAIRPFDACSCCKLNRYCSTACQRQAFDRGHNQSCGSSFPTQKSIEKASPRQVVATLREFGSAHAYVAMTCLARLNHFATERANAVVGGSDSQSKAARATESVMLDIINNGAVEAVLWAMHAHLRPLTPEARSHCAVVQGYGPYQLMNLFHGTYDKKARARVEAEFLAGRGVAALANAMGEYPNDKRVQDTTALCCQTLAEGLSEAGQEELERQALEHAASMV